MISLGCAKNRVDSEVMLALLQERGWVPSPTDEADVIVINTCSFIREAQEESIEMILNMAAAKESGKCRRLVVTGCLPQRFGSELITEIPEVDLFLGTGEVPRIGTLLDNFPEEDSPQKALIGEPAYLYDHHTPRVVTSPPGSMYLKITEGCSNFCSYCVIPRIRGKLRSRALPSVWEEAQQAVSRGVKEIILIGQDITQYGRDRKEGPRLAELLRELTTIEGLQWIRLLYTHPAHLTPDVIHLIAEERKICKYLDLPLQHIDDGILKAMNRNVSEEEIRELIGRLRREIPGIILRTSLMVGFPGETKNRYEKLLRFVRETQFDRLGVFTYSRENGTPAASLKGQVSEKIKAGRYHETMALQKQISRQKQKELFGSRVTVLVEGPGKTGNVLWEGRTQGQAPDVDGVTFITKGDARPGEMVEVLITETTVYDLYGEIIHPTRTA